MEFQNLALDPNSSFGTDVFIRFPHYFYAGHLLFVLHSAVKEMATCPYLELIFCLEAWGGTIHLLQHTFPPQSLLNTLESAQCRGQIFLSPLFFPHLLPFIFLQTWG